MPLNFHNSDLKSTVDLLMNELWAGGVADPTVSIEQIGYLMFLKSLTEMDEQQEKLAALTHMPYASVFIDSARKYSWRVIARLAGDELYHTLTEAFENLHTLPNLSPVGKILFKQAHLQIYNRPTLRSVITLIDALDFNNAEKYDTDARGDLYEYLLNHIAVSGKLGQFRTPRHIIKSMIEVVQPKPSDLILDPACGTAGFLIEAYKYIVRTNTHGDRTLTHAQYEFLRTKAINGFDNTASMIKVALMNLYLHDLAQAQVINFDPLTLPEQQKRKYDLILANPPFAGKIKKEAIQEEIGLDCTKTELLFVKYMMDHLVEGGRCAVIVPEGVLFGGSRAHKKLRELLLDTCRMDAIVSLPAGVFKPYAGVKTSILFFTKGGATDRVWFYDVVGDGFTLDDHRSPDPKNDNLKDLPAAFAKKAAGTHRWFATRAQIAENDGNLSAHRYQPHTAETVIHEDPKKIIEEVVGLERDIADRLGSLKELL